MHPIINITSSENDLSNNGLVMRIHPATPCSDPFGIGEGRVSDSWWLQNAERSQKERDDELTSPPNDLRVD
jgi:hypothetical protein